MVKKDAHGSDGNKAEGRKVAKRPEIDQGQLDLAARNEPSPVRYEKAGLDGVGIVWIDVPGKKVNTLSVQLMPAFERAFDEMRADTDCRAVVIASGKEAGFIAGADIDDLGEARSAEEGAALSRQGQQSMQRIADAPVPTVAAIHGDCLGGGLELALACTARVAANDPKTKLALPEVMLGLLPGAGGTQRLPQLVGLANALDMMLTGRNIRPHKAQKMGLVDEVVPRSQLIEAARAAAVRLSQGKPARAGKPPKKKMPDEVQSLLLERNALGRKLVLHEARKKVMKQSKGVYPAPLRILDVADGGGYDGEARAFGELLMSKESAGLRHLFHCITALKKDNGPHTEGVAAVPVNRAGMLGAGLMGAGIATVLADKGVPVRLKDRDHESITKALDYARKVYGKARKRKQYSQAGFDERLARISGGTDMAGFGRADIVIEAVFESLDLKRKMIADVEAAAKVPTIFATNTSSLPIAEIARDAAHPERVIGMHFFSPVEKMPLVEVIVTDQTAPWVTATTVAVARKMGKHVIVVGDCAGFYTTRVLTPYMSEAIFLLLEGYAIEDIDEAAIRIGFPVGPVTLMDEVGIDVGAKVMEVMEKYYGGRMEFPDGTTKPFIEEGRLGRKASKGFYLYENGKSTIERGKKLVDETIYDHLPNGKHTRKPNLGEMGERMVLALVNEAVTCLEEGILFEPMAGDLGAVMGIGFPPFEGGPFRYVDRFGAQNIVTRLTALESRCGRRFKPCAMLVGMASEGALFHEGQGAG